MGWYFVGGDGLAARSRLEAVLLILDHAFTDRRLRKLWSDVLGDNAPALVFNEGLGFVVEGRQRAHVLHEGRLKDLVLVALFREDYFERNAARRRRLLGRGEPATP